MTAVEGQTRLLIVDGHSSHVTDDFMFECFIHDIYLLYLPAHSSHITQPCDLCPFSLLKKAYRRLLSNLVLLTDSSPIGKQNFLRCYAQARMEAFKPANVRQGWLATGLWPINILKPLLSPYLLNPTKEVTQPDPEPPAKAPLPSEPKLFTPLRSNQMLQQFQHRGQQSAGTRLLIRKTGKSLDDYVFKLAQRDRTIKALQLENERLKPKKRMRVVPDPNKRFVEIRQIAQAQAAAAAALAAEEVAEAIEGEEETQDCIWVAN